MASARSVPEIWLFLYRFNVKINGNFYMRTIYVERNVPCTHPYTNRAAARLSLAFMMAAIRALLAGENAHSRGQLESEKTNRRMQILQVRL